MSSDSRLALLIVFFFLACGDNPLWRLLPMYVPTNSGNWQSNYCPEHLILWAVWFLYKFLFKV